MPRVRFLSEGQAIEVGEGTTLLEAARQANVLIETACATEGTCGKCGVRLGLASLQNVIPGGRHRLGAQGFVLSCDTRVIGPVDVETLHRGKEQLLQVLTDGVCAATGLDPFIARELDPSADATRIWGGDRLLATLAGDQTGSNLGCVVDLGTTTLVVALVDLATGRELAVRSALNPQATFAQDVMSRIKFASAANGLDTLERAVSGTVRQLVRELAAEAKIPPSSIYEIVYSGNTCMLHLAVGQSPRSMGQYPYPIQLRGGKHVAAGPLRLGVADGALIYLPPVASAFVGADITSGVVATSLDQLPGTTLFLDVGTNGEMVLARDGRLAATSTAAGPAFEGMNISCGMRAAAGAIDSVQIEEDGSLKLTVIGAVDPTGLCGTGLIDAVSELVRRGVIGRTGRFNDPAKVEPPALRARLTSVAGKPAFQLSPTVFLSQSDVRQLQLAKAATRVGVDFLLRVLEVPLARLDRVLIAGGFGHALKPESVVGIGLLPPEVREKIEFVGNTSKTGGRALLLDQGLRAAAQQLVGRIEVLELTHEPGFDRHFAERIGF